MRVHQNIQELPAFKNAVVTIGTFDGVHLGHQQIIRQLKKEADEISGESVIITFHPHPRKIVAGGKPVHILNTLPEKTELLNANKIDHLVVVPFDNAFAEQSAAEYVEKFLVEKFHPHTVIIGYDHRFGKGRAGDYHLLEDYGEKLGFLVKEIPERVLNEITISSTAIRNALLHGKIDIANSYLGYDYFFEGIVVKGAAIGKTIGYPTANLHIEQEEKLVPANGVYAVQVQIKNNAADNFEVPRLNGMMNIGIRPTFNGSSRMIEVHLLGFDDNLYDKTIRVYIKEYIRSEIKFSGIDALKAQLAKDKLQTENILKT